MGLYKQPNDWTCGPFALKHALVALGRLPDERAITRVVDPHWWAGADEVKLARAARHFDCDLPMVRRTNADRAQGALVRQLGGSLPVLLCVDEWEHWITVVHHEHDRFVIVDSKNEPVLHVMSWPQLRRRWEYVEYDDEDEPVRLYDLHPVRPRFRVTVKARFSVERAQFLRRPENASLALHWDAYLADLMEICRPRTRKDLRAISMGEFLRRRQDLLVSRVRYWHGDVERESIVRMLRNFRFVAETYGLVIPLADTRRALVDLSILLAFWAAASRGVGSMYGTDSPRKPRQRRPRR